MLSAEWLWLMVVMSFLSHDEIARSAHDEKIQDLLLSRSFRRVDGSSIHQSMHPLGMTMMFGKRQAIDDDHQSGGMERTRPLLGNNNNPNVDSEMQAHVQTERKVAFRLVTAVFAALVLGSVTMWRSRLVPEKHVLSTVDTTNKAGREPVPRFERSSVRVRENLPGFPSFWNYHDKGPINVTYDERAMKLNGERVVLLGGSAHPIRATSATWEAAMDEAVRNGMNLVTIFVFWSAHQPFQDTPMDWSLPGYTDSRYCASMTPHPDDGDHSDSSSGNDKTGEKMARDGDDECRWTLATAIRQAANRGLFVHLRVGPYACAEYNYGGIPEWLPWSVPNLSMRRPNKDWMNLMEYFLREIIHYVDSEKLWANQGGPIIMAQVENELDGEIDETDQVVSVVVHEDGTEDGIGIHDMEDIHRDDSTKHGRQTTTIKKRNATMQDYAEWSGRVAAKYAPDVVWTMCNGLTANNTINTCNGMGDCPTSYLERYGQTGRIQKDQPAMWTEDEAGFQVWGETPSEPTFYFWGRRARDMVRDGLRWFSRGGTHLNYYMLWGGYNRERHSASAVANWYAADALLCPSGQRHEPMFSHFRAFHNLITSMAPLLLSQPTALKHEQAVEVQGDGGTWYTANTTDQCFFVYASDSDYAVFVENNVGSMVRLRLEVHAGIKEEMTLGAYGNMVFLNGMPYNLSEVDPSTTKHRRITVDSPNQLTGWTHWAEPFDSKENIASDKPGSRDRQTIGSAPIEQIRLMVDHRVSSDYAWYGTNVTTSTDVHSVSLSVDTQRANGFVVFMNETFVGANDHRIPGEESITVRIDIGNLPSGKHRLKIMSESFGSFNLVGNPGFSAKAKIKGLTGSVNMTATRIDGTNCTITLVDGRLWTSSPGLNGAPAADIGASVLKTEDNNGIVDSNGIGTDSSNVVPPCSWSAASFEKPYLVEPTQALFLQTTSGRGHVWLNGFDLGRFWNITRGTTDQYSMEYYLLPSDWLQPKTNTLVFFNALGGDYSETKLVISSIIGSRKSHLKDEVAYADACI